MGQRSEFILNQCVPEVKYWSVQIQGRKLEMACNLGKQTLDLSNSILRLATNLLLQTPQLYFLKVAFLPVGISWQLRCFPSRVQKLLMSLLLSPSMELRTSSQFSLSRSRMWQFWAEKFWLIRLLMQLEFIFIRRPSATFSSPYTFSQHLVNQFSGYNSSNLVSSSFKEAQSFSLSRATAARRQLLPCSVLVSEALRLAACPRLSMGYFSSSAQCLLVISSAGQQYLLHSLG